MSILQCSAHILQASCETLSYTFLPSSLSKGGSSSPGISFLNFTQNTMCVMTSLETKFRIHFQQTILHGTRFAYPPPHEPSTTPHGEQGDQTGQTSQAEQLAEIECAVVPRRFCGSQHRLAIHRHLS